jgi:hypothetical protein
MEFNQTLLLVIIGLLGLVVIGLVAMAIVVRRRGKPVPLPMPEPVHVHVLRWFVVVAVADSRSRRRPRWSAPRAAPNITAWRTARAMRVVSCRPKKCSAVHSAH